MEYLDAFVAAVPSDKKNEYMKHAELAKEVFKKHGAVRVVECWGDDVPDGEKTSFLSAVQCQSDETVVLPWISWPSKQARDEGMPAIMEDMESLGEMPFDGSRVIFGGFNVVMDV